MHTVDSDIMPSFTLQACSLFTISSTHACVIMSIDIYIYIFIYVYIYIYTPCFLFYTYIYIYIHTDTYDQNSCHRMQLNSFHGPARKLVLINRSNCWKNSFVFYKPVFSRLQQSTQTYSMISLTFSQYTFTLNINIHRYTSVS